MYCKKGFREEIKNLPSKYELQLFSSAGLVLNKIFKRAASDADHAAGVTDPKIKAVTEDARDGRSKRRGLL